MLGSILYRIAIQLALSSDVLGLQASDLNLVTAVLVTRGAHPAAPASRRSRIVIALSTTSRSSSARGTPLEKQALNGVNLTIEERLVRHRHRLERRRQVDAARRSGRRRACRPRARCVIGTTDVTPQADGGARRPRGPRVPGSAGRQLRRAVDRGEPGPGRPRAASGAASLGAQRQAPRPVSANASPRSNLGLENRMRDRMDLLSGGQRQAVSLVMATLAGSDVLLLDEHTAALDPGMAEFIMEPHPEDRVRSAS